MKRWVAPLPGWAVSIAVFLGIATVIVAVTWTATMVDLYVYGNESRFHDTQFQWSLLWWSPRQGSATLWLHSKWQWLLTAAGAGFAGSSIAFFRGWVSRNR